MRRLLLIASVLFVAWYFYDRFIKPPPPPPPPPPVLQSKPAPRIVDPEQLQRIIESTTDLDPTVRWEAAKLLDEMQAPQALSTMYEMLLNDQDAGVRKNIVGLMEKHSTPQTNQHLVQALQDTDVEVRIAVLVTLSKIGDSTTTSAISDSLKDSDERVRLQALKTLNELQKKFRAGQEQQEALRKESAQKNTQR